MPFCDTLHVPASNGVAFTGEGKLVRKATGYEQEKAEAALSHIGFAGCASRASGAHWSVSVTHRFLRRGKFEGLMQLIDSMNRQTSDMKRKHD